MCFPLKELSTELDLISLFKKPFIFFKKLQKPLKLNVSEAKLQIIALTLLARMSPLHVPTKLKLVCVL